MNLESKPKQIEKKGVPEITEKTGNKFLSDELDRLPDSKRAGGFLLTTFVAMGFALAGAGGAEAQVRTNRFPMGGPTSGMTGEIFQQGRIGASQAMERKKMEAGVKINLEYQGKIQEIDVKKSQLAQDFKNKNISASEFGMRRQQLDNEVYRLSRERDVKLINPLGVKGRILESMIRGY